MDQQRDYSQHGEQEIILKTLGAGKPGSTGPTRRLLDIGAWVPDTFSNTRALLDAGWEGVLVEPSPGPFKQLIDHYRDNPKVLLVQAVVGLYDGWVEFHDSGGDAVSSTDMAHVQRWKAGFNVPYRAFNTWAISPATLFDRLGYNFEFINLDAEATSAKLFMLLPFHRLDDLRCVCVEHDNRGDEILQRAGEFGFKHVWHNNENLIIAR